MSQSYTGGGRTVNARSKPPAAAPSPPEPHPRDRPRDTATFVPYYWEAYNEIVEPRRFDHYLINRWARELGPTGFLILKVLRDRCYHNPLTGVLRNECEIDMDQLAAQIGIGRTALYEAFKKNVALQQFVRRQERYRMVNGKPQRTTNLFEVSMDDPIHPDDMERYDDLRAVREMDRARPTSGKIIVGEDGAPYESTIRTHSKTGTKPMNTDSGLIGEKPASMSSESGQQIRCPDLAQQIRCPESGQRIEDLPPDRLTKESLTPAAGSPHKSPKGEPGDRNGGETPLPPELVLWELAQPALQAALSIPTYNAHVRPLRPLEAVIPPPDSAAPVEIVLHCPTEFCRAWLERERNRTALETALSGALGRAAVVQLVRLPDSAPAAQEGRAA